MSLLSQIPGLNMEVEIGQVGRDLLGELALRALRGGVSIDLSTWNGLTRDEQEAFVRAGDALRAEQSVQVAQSIVALTGAQAADAADQRACREVLEAAGG